MRSKTLLLGIMAAVYGLGTPQASTADEPRSRTFEFNYRAVISNIPEGAGKIDIWLPYPQSDELQVIRDIKVSSPYETRLGKEDKYENSVLHVTVKDPDQTSIEVEFSFLVDRKEHRADLDQADKVRDAETKQSLAKWLQPDRLVPLDDPIREMAAQVTAGKATSMEKARAIYDHVVTTMKYDRTGTGWGQGDLQYACDARRGNCTDFHALFIGLARAAGIPAKFEIGFPIPPERGEGTVGGYHCWAEFHVDGHGWIPVDASEASKHPEKKEYFFGAHDENRVLFSIGRDIILSPRQAGEPLNYFIYPYVEVDRVPFKTLDLQFTYKDVGGAPKKEG